MSTCMAGPGCALTCLRGCSCFSAPDGSDCFRYCVTPAGALTPVQPAPPPGWASPGRPLVISTRNTSRKALGDLIAGFFPGEVTRPDPPPEGELQIGHATMTLRTLGAMVGLRFGG
ncbi:MAG: hypothetical protein AB7U46_16765 [Paenirhodobacter sp.]|uniref:hypothetical protein n=1 Tax=Paenirhodobacter sp. TaxID=1965326 RepID=UPI003D0AA7A0